LRTLFACFAGTNSRNDFLRPAIAI
jgi:hypothetical protein